MIKSDQENECIEEKEFFEAYENLYKNILSNPNPAITPMGEALIAITKQRGRVIDLDNQMHNAILELCDRSMKLISLTLDAMPATHKDKR